MNQRTVVLVGMVAFLSCCAGCRDKAETTPEKQKTPREPAQDTKAQETVGEHHIVSQPPEGFVALFNGNDLTGWKGLVGDPASRAKMSPQDLAKAQLKADEQMHAHWKVVDGVLVFDGKGHSLCTAKDYGDFELLVDWKIEPAGTAGSICGARRRCRYGTRRSGRKAPAGCTIIRKGPASR